MPEENNQLPAKYNRLPTLAELHHDPEAAFKEDELKYLLNQPPVEKWLKKHPYAPSTYLPIDKVELLMDRIFQQWKVEVIQVGVMLQSIHVTIRLHYKHPGTGEWLFHDGVGAQPVQLDSGAAPSDLTKIKQSAVQMALPMAKSYAIKDAADHLGKLFGRDVNRKGTIDFQGAYSQAPDKQKADSSKRILDVIAACKTVDQLKKNLGYCNTPEAKEAYDKRFNELKSML